MACPSNTASSWFSWGVPVGKVDAVLRQIDNGAAFAGTVMHFVGIGDNELASFYRAAAFCVYPLKGSGCRL